MNVIKEIEKFQTTRMLDKQEFDAGNEAVNIIEEVLEMHGYAVPKEERSFLKYEWVRFIERQVEAGSAVPTTYFDTESKVDAFADIIVFAVGAIMKLGYDPTCVLKEVALEINSRHGSIVDGKFQKDTSPEAKAKWYKADFTWCAK